MGSAVGLRGGDVASREELKAFRKSRGQAQGRAAPRSAGRATRQHGRPGLREALTQTSMGRAAAHEQKPALLRSSLATSAPMFFRKGAPFWSFLGPCLFLLSAITTCTAPYDDATFEYPKSDLIAHVGALGANIKNKYERIDYDIDLTDTPTYGITIGDDRYRIDATARGALQYKQGIITPIRPEIWTSDPRQLTQSQEAAYSESYGVVGAWLGSSQDTWSKNAIFQAAKEAAREAMVFTVPDSDRKKIEEGWVTGIYGRGDHLAVETQTYDWGPLGIASVVGLVVGLVATVRLAFTFLAP